MQKVRQGNRGQARSGFTIVELLIVVVVIAILAAITIVSYNGITKQAAIAELQSDAHGAVQQVETQGTFDGSFPTDISGFNDGDGIRHGSNTTVEYTSDGTTYCMTVSSAKAGKSYKFTPGSGQVEGVCAGHTGVVGGDSFGWTAVAAGETSTCGIAAGKLYCWGMDYDGSTTTTPQLMGGVLSGKTVTKIAGAASHACAIADGKAYCWGSNYSGQLGDTTLNGRSDPEAVSTSGVLSGKTIKDIAVGGSHTCAVTTDNVMACWGEGSDAQLGTLATGTKTSPTAIVLDNGSGWTSPVAGKTITSMMLGNNHTCVVASSHVYCWGGNSRAQLGRGDTYVSYVPAEVLTTGALSGVTIAKTGTGGSAMHSCVISTTSAVYCWQTSTYATTLNGTGVSSNAPQAVVTSGVLSGKSVTDSSGSGSMNCVVASDKVYCWGSSQGGQLGDGSGNDSYLPVKVDDSGVLSGKTVTAVSVGASYACALAEGNIYCWGVNYDGRLGDGSTTDRTTPVKVADPS